MTDEFASVSPVSDDVSDETDVIQPEAAPVLVEDAAEVEVAAPVQTSETFWQTLRRRLWPSPAELMQQAESQLHDLDEAISLKPDEPTNYVLRGELFLKVRAYELALADFQHAVEIASQQIENNDWGIIAQIMQDRALRGLQQAERQIQSKTQP